MILSKARPSVSSQGERARSSHGQRKPQVSALNRCLELRDYTGAIVLLQFKRHEANLPHKMTLEWLAYCHFHHGEHDKALDVYRELLESPNADNVFHNYAAACLFYMGLYQEAQEEALKGPESPLQTRILFHCAHRLNDEEKLMNVHDKLGDQTEDMLSLASIHYLRGHYQEATDIYKQHLSENRDWLALNVYIALCYYNLDYHDVSLEVLTNYLQVCPDSALAMNLKACNNFKLFNGKAAEADMKALENACGGQVENDLVRHNQVVFRNGEGALQVFPPLVGILPEARLNLAIYYLRNNQAKQAYEMLKSMDPSSPQEYILKAVTLAMYGQEAELGEVTKQAHQLFQLVGTSASECDTIPGRQCMASCFFLLKQYDDTIIYLKSIKSYCVNQDEFNWNYGIAKAANGEFQDAEESLQAICSDSYRSSYSYKAWLSHCYIMNDKARLAWEQYVQFEGSDDSFSLLVLIANECYKTGQYLYAAKAFDVLERIDDCTDYWDAKRGACIGVFQNIIVGKEPNEHLGEVVGILRNSNHPQVEYILRVMQKWAKDNGVIPF
ncbi:intraflagellar transport protein 56 [Marchantia polymorpha subsp. ruderalis]|uniref:Intraflagellar transport protein 56 n=1 Tax=Marchantia polymorpha TaxID=3197 RepID=A0A2R6W4R2_MARPO|nr:hypothetical protein MARPO_0154s0012 [Marchantia polymorpha]PTQ28782.1 hypothetical protein MARPO_0154s0012 [Marchantia polymorpha]BBN20111.1 hypothetical protein Mp_8g16520 [Marchantia polymorpha subsp. ruderalis]BBN20112.1 hypothetical protein Mp_8g16520 [Marchantia polymorpha subsp. ruderalis]|eukprot:PTQ28781.1 hypothetical protein MARPO_0154s0012 [Marchantia polymorpha]